MGKLPTQVLFLDQFGYFGGGQRALWQTLEVLRPTPTRVAVALSGKGDFRDKVVRSKIPVLTLPLGDYRSGRKNLGDHLGFVLRSIYTSLLLTRWIGHHKFDVLFANGPRTFLAASVAGWLTGKPVIWFVHLVFRPGPELRLMLLLSGWVHRILVCSKAVGAPFLSARPLLQPKVKLVHYPHPGWDRLKLVDRRMKLRREFRLRDGEVCLGILGRITPFKGQIPFVQAAEKVLAETSSAQFFIVGAPTKEDPNDHRYYRRLGQVLEHSCSRDRFCLIDHQPEVEDYLAMMDIVVIATQGPEALPQTIIEAMFLGKALIAPASGGIPEMLQHDYSGVLVERADVNSLAESMLRLIRDPEKRSSLGQMAQKEAQGLFSPQTFQRNIQETLEDCLAPLDPSMTSPSGGEPKT